MSAIVEARPPRALTLWQPRASAMARLGKTVENRPAVIALREG